MGSPFFVILATTVKCHLMNPEDLSGYFLGFGKRFDAVRDGRLPGTRIDREDDGSQ